MYTHTHTHTHTAWSHRERCGQFASDLGPGREAMTTCHPNSDPTSRRSGGDSVFSIKTVSELWLWIVAGSFRLCSECGEPSGWPRCAIGVVSKPKVGNGFLRAGPHCARSRVEPERPRINGSKGAGKERGEYTKGAVRGDEMGRRALISRGICDPPAWVSVAARNLSAPTLQPPGRSGRHSRTRRSFPPSYRPPPTGCRHAIARRAWSVFMGTQTDTYVGNSNFDGSFHHLNNSHCSEKNCPLFRIRSVIKRARAIRKMPERRFAYWTSLSAGRWPASSYLR